MVGIDLNSTINAYYQRDISMNLNNANTIIKHLRKLGYYNINLNVEEELYLKFQIINWVKNNSCLLSANVTLNDIISQIKNSEDYMHYRDKLYSKIERTNNLCRFISSTDTYEFYSALTLNELNYIGY
jgi:hypothetical protein